jgi:uncharacterized membrane protein YqjE
MLALTLDQAKNGAIVAAVVLLVLAVVAARLVQAIIGKVIATVILLALVAIVWSQRASLQSCADELRDKATRLDSSTTTCTFLGFDVEVSLPDPGGA